MPARNSQHRHRGILPTLPLGGFFGPGLHLLVRRPPKGAPARGHRDGSTRGRRKQLSTLVLVRRPGASQ